MHKQYSYSYPPPFINKEEEEERKKEKKRRKEKKKKKRILNNALKIKSSCVFASVVFIVLVVHCDTGKVQCFIVIQVKCSVSL